jgi:hypothetical protein
MPAGTLHLGLCTTDAKVERSDPWLAAVMMQSASAHHRYIERWHDTPLPGGIGSNASSALEGLLPARAIAAARSLAARVCSDP